MSPFFQVANQRSTSLTPWRRALLSNSPTEEKSKRPTSGSTCSQ
jgi:hypothetical protein